LREFSAISWTRRLGTTVVQQLSGRPFFRRPVDGLEPCGLDAPDMTIDQLHRALSQGRNINSVKDANDAVRALVNEVIRLRDEVQRLERKVHDSSGQVP
jgi:hypothetical protein